MQFDNKKFNVLIRGKHTLFVVAQMDGKRRRDAEKLRLQIANMLSVESKMVVPNHDYKELPAGNWFCFRYKGQIPARIRRPSVEEDRHLFCAKEAVLNLVDEVKIAKVGKTLQPMPGTEEEIVPQREEEAVPMPPTSADDTMMLLLTQVLKNQQYLAEIVARMALKL